MSDTAEKSHTASCQSIVSASSSVTSNDSPSKKIKLNLTSGKLGAEQLTYSTEEKTEGAARKRPSNDADRVDAKKFKPTAITWP